MHKASNHLDLQFKIFLFPKRSIPCVKLKQQNPLISCADNSHNPIPLSRPTHTEIEKLQHWHLSEALKSYIIASKEINSKIVH